jgi:HTH-type transcriptional regulator, competence development regulator
MAMNGLGAALKALRERRTLTTRELGTLADVDHSYIHRLETGEKDSPSSEVAGRILKVLRPSERDSQVVRWLVEHEADPELVRYVLDDPSVEIEVFTMAAGARHRGNVRPSPAELVARVRRALDAEE